MTSACGYVHGKSLKLLRLIPFYAYVSEAILHLVQCRCQQNLAYGAQIVTEM